MSSSAALLTTLVLLSAAVLPLDVSAGGGFSIELIHRDSPKSPYYNSSATHFDRIRAAFHRSISRAARIVLLCALPSSSTEFQSQLLPDTGSYLMRLTLGSPPVERLLIADTGSNIIWTQCTPCTNCYEQDAPIFNPAESSTYKKVSCSSPACHSMRETDSCNTSDNSCLFGLSYVDNSHSFGTLSTETFGFDSTTGGQGVTFPELVFGCATDSAGTFDPKSSGLVGLGNGPGSLINQLNSTIDGKFSYCMVPYTQSSASSVLSFGDKAVVTGDGAVSTPLISRDTGTFYYVTLEDITVGSNESQKIAVVKRVDGSSSETGNAIVDSGSNVSFLDEDVVSAVEKQVSDIIKLPPATQHDNEFRLCYDSSQFWSNPDIPDITFEYTGASVKLSTLNTFISPQEGIVCLAILPHLRGSGVNTIGNIAQQNFHVGYDLQAMTLTFAPANCSSL